MPKILIVEDEANNVEIFTRLLTRSGFQCEVATNKEAAVAKARDEMPELILMDIRMPLTDGGEESQHAGLEATREIKSLPETSGIPVIALTGDAMRDFRTRMAEAGFSDYVEKPVTDYAAFVGTIRKHLDSAPA